MTVLGNTGELVYITQGSAFVGWNTSSDGSGTTYSEGETFMMGSANVTLYAEWFTPTEDASAALLAGTKIYDDTEDYENIHGDPNPENYYLEFTDLIEADFGLDRLLPVYQVHIRWDMAG